MTTNKLIQDSINTGAVSLQTYNRGGIHVHTESIPEIYRLDAFNVPVNNTRSWNLAGLDVDIIPVSIWGNFSQSGGSSGGSLTLTLMMGTTVLNSLTIPLANLNAGYTLPLVLLRPTYTLNLVCDRAITNLSIYAKPAYFLQSLNAI